MFQSFDWFYCVWIINLTRFYILCLKSFTGFTVCDLVWLPCILCYREFTARRVPGTNLVLVISEPVKEDCEKCSDKVDKDDVFQEAMEVTKTESKFIFSNLAKVFCYTLFWHAHWMKKETNHCSLLFNKIYQQKLKVQGFPMYSAMWLLVQLQYNRVTRWNWITRTEVVLFKHRIVCVISYLTWDWYSKSYPSVNT